MQFDLHQPFFLCLFVIILCHALLECTIEYKLHIKALVLVLMHKHLLHKHSQVGIRYLRHEIQAFRLLYQSKLRQSFAFFNAFRISDPQIYHFLFTDHFKLTSFFKEITGTS